MALFKEFVNDFLRNPKALSWEIDPQCINHPDDRVFVAGLAKDFHLLLELNEEHAFVLRKCLVEDEDSALEEDEQGNIYCTAWEFTLDTAKIINRYEKRPIISELSPPEELLRREEELFVEWKARYYAAKMELRTQDQLDTLLAAYCEGLEWVMRYYFEGVASWGWYFPFHYAPFMSDVISYLQSGKFRNDKCIVKEYSQNQNFLSFRKIQKQAIRLGSPVQSLGAVNERLAQFKFCLGSRSIG